MDTQPIQRRHTLVSSDKCRAVPRGHQPSYQALCCKSARRLYGLHPPLPLLLLIIIRTQQSPWIHSRLSVTCWQKLLTVLTPVWEVEVEQQLRTGLQLTLSHAHMRRESLRHSHTSMLERAAGDRAEVPVNKTNRQRRPIDNYCYKIS